MLICAHDERTGGELHGASEFRKPETQALHLRHAGFGVSGETSTWQGKCRKVGYWVMSFSSQNHAAIEVMSAVISKNWPQGGVLRWGGEKKSLFLSSKILKLGILYAQKIETSSVFSLVSYSCFMFKPVSNVDFILFHFILVFFFNNIVSYVLKINILPV